jgi:DNA (cytosine-5)-methyltransferase 1
MMPDPSKKNSGLICESPSVTMMPDPSNSAKVILDKNLVDSEMVESDDGSCCFVGEAVPEEEARQRWPHRYEKNHHFVEKVGTWLHYLLFARLHHHINDIRTTEQDIVIVKHKNEIFVVVD